MQHLGNRTQLTFSATQSFAQKSRARMAALLHGQM